jgi:hypothetical protein
MCLEYRCSVVVGLYGSAPPARFAMQAPCQK